MILHPNKPLKLEFGEINFPPFFDGTVTDMSEEDLLGLLTSTLSDTIGWGHLTHPLRPSEVLEREVEGPFVIVHHWALRTHLTSIVIL